MDEEMKRLVHCPFCKSGFRMLVEGRMEGYFKCLQCDRRFALPSVIEERESEPSVLRMVMP